MEMVKLEKNIHKTWNVLTIFKKEGATIIATTSLYHLLKSNYIVTVATIKTKRSKISCR